MRKLIARYRAWREHTSNNGEGPVIWWPLARFRVFFAHESWSLPLAIHWEDEGVSPYGGSHYRGIVVGILCFSCYIDLTQYSKRDGGK